MQVEDLMDTLSEFYLSVKRTLGISLRPIFRMLMYTVEEGFSTIYATVNGLE